MTARKRRERARVALIDMYEIPQVMVIWVEVNFVFTVPIDVGSKCVTCVDGVLGSLAHFYASFCSGLLV